MMPERPAAGAGVRPAARFSRLTVMFLTLRRTYKGALLMGAVFGLVIFVNSAGFASAYPTAVSRRVLAATLGSNAGLQAMLGEAHNIDTIGGFVQWRSGVSLLLLGGFWALMVTTRQIRGEEEAGRWELLLSGQTTRMRAVAGAVAGLGIDLTLIFLVTAILAVLTSMRAADSYAVAGAIYFALSTIGGASVAMALSMLSCQLLPTRRAAVSWAAGVFGGLYLLRVAADSAASLGWLRWLTPLGWIEELHPLTGGRPLALLPWAGFFLLCALLSIYLAGRRDMGASLLPDRDTAPPRLRLLSGPLGLTLRLARLNLLAWAAALLSISFLYGVLANTAADALSESGAISRILGKLGAHSQAVLNFLGMGFFMYLAVVTLYAASAAAATREEEASGMVENLLVRSVSRGGWLMGRTGVSAIAVAVLSLASGLAAWAGAASQGSSITLSSTLAAGVNLLPPALFILGFGTLVHGLAPRLTAYAAYGLIAWSFLLELIGSAVNLSPWLLDLSLFHHVALAPAADVRWGASLVLTGIGVAGVLAGMLFFRRRDLAGW